MAVSEKRTAANQGQRASPAERPTKTKSNLTLSRSYGYCSMVRVSGLGRWRLGRRSVAALVVVLALGLSTASARGSDKRSTLKRLMAAITGRSARTIRRLRLTTGVGRAGKGVGLTRTHRRFGPGQASQAL